MTRKATLPTPGLPRWSSPLKTVDGRLLASDGARVCRWIQSNCVYGEGDYYGAPVKLREFQRRFIYRLYERHEDGRRRYRRALLGMGKGNGKTPLASWIGAYELCSPQRISPRVIIGAASLKQANLVFGDLRTTLKESASLRGLVEPYELQIFLKDRPGLAERIAAEAGTNDGARCTAFIADELHEWEGRTERVYLIIDGAVAKRRDAFTLAISTAGVMHESLLLSLYDHGIKLAKGEVKDDGFLFEWYESDPDLDLEDEAEWLRAVYQANPAAGDFNDLASLRHRFDTMPRFEFERYHLNRWTSAYNHWIPMARWDGCGGDPTIEPGETVYVGIDGAAKRDTTAVYLIHRDAEGLLHTKGRVFEAPPDEVIDPEPVKAYLRELDRTYWVKRFLFDPHLFWPIAQELREEGLQMEEVPQTVPRKIGYSQALFDAVMEERLRHGGDSVLRSHAEGAVAKDRGDGWTLEKLRASRHIDALVAVGMAIEAAEIDANTAEPQIAVF